MLFTVTNPFTVIMTRSGGADQEADVTVYESNATGTHAVGYLNFINIGSQAEVQSFTPPLPAGTYTCLLRSFVGARLNGKYDFEVQIPGNSVFARSGDLFDDPTADTDGGPPSKEFPQEHFTLQVN